MTWVLGRQGASPEPVPGGRDELDRDCVVTYALQRVTMVMIGVMFDDGQFQNTDLDAALGEWRENEGLSEWLRRLGYEHNSGDGDNPFTSDSITTREYWGFVQYWNKTGDPKTIAILQDGETTEIIVCPTAADRLRFRFWVRQFLAVQHQAFAARIQTEIAERSFRHRFDHDVGYPCRDCESESEARDRRAMEKKDKTGT